MNEEEIKDLLRMKLEDQHGYLPDEAKHAIENAWWIVEALADIGTIRF